MKAIAFAALVVATAVHAGPPATKTEGSVKIVAWPGYIERGESDKKYDWVTQFEKESGCKVEVKTANTSDEMVKLLLKPGYDLVTASGDASVRLIKSGHVQPVDVAKVPSWSRVDPRLQNASWHTAEGKHYGVPYQWGPNVLMYNTKVFSTPPTSWSVLFTAQNLPDGKPNKGRIEAYDGPIAIADAALYLMRSKPELGIKDPYELSPEQYAAVTKLLKDQRPLVLRYWHDTTAHTDDFKKGLIAASSAWPYQVNSLKGEGQPVESTIPKEGCTGWADTTMLVADAPHPVCAYKWLEWSLKPEVQAAVSEWFGSLPAAPDACKTKAPGGTDFCKTNGFDRFADILFWKTPELKCVTQKTCAPYIKWDKDYSAIKDAQVASSPAP
ncbi:MAG: ABC transporter substrate-binding protein [Myxococcaceae bacterium]